MTRHVKRRLRVIGAAAAVGAASPLWGPLVLRNVPIFGVEEVHVVGHRFADPDDLRARAGLDEHNSVWDDMRTAEARVASHPLVETASLRRAGLHRLELYVREIRPVALAATPGLVPVDADGRALDLDPAGRSLDLPILADAELVDGRVEPEAARRALDVLEQISDLDSAFARRISELRPVRGTSVEFVLLPGSPLERVLLPFHDPATAFLRVGSAVRLAEARGAVEEADARFENEVVIRMGRAR